jgi:hypothetical protein
MIAQLRYILRSCLLQVRLGLIDAVKVAFQQLNAVERAIGQALLDVIDTSLLQLEAVAVTHRKQRGAGGAQTGEVKGIGIGEDLGSDKSVVVLG